MWMEMMLMMMGTEWKQNQLLLPSCKQLQNASRSLVALLLHILLLKSRRRMRRRHKWLLHNRTTRSSAAAAAAKTVRTNWDEGNVIRQRLKWSDIMSPVSDDDDGYPFLFKYSPRLDKRIPYPFRFVQHVKSIPIFYHYNTICFIFLQEISINNIISL